MNTYPGIITSRRTRRNLRHFRLLPINPPTESAVQFRAARALNQLSSHASLLVGKWRHCRNSTNYQHHIWRPEKISNSVTLFAVRPIITFINFSWRLWAHIKHDYLIKFTKQVAESCRKWRCSECNSNFLSQMNHIIQDVFAITKHVFFCFIIACA